MTQPENNINEEQDEIVNEELAPIIPSWVLIIAAALGLFVVVGVLFISPTFNIFGWAGAAIAVLSLIVWAFMYPEEIVNMIKGRSLTYGGLGIAVTLFFVIASMLVYNVIAAQGWSRDLSERDIFSLDTQVRDVLEAMGDDPSIPTVQFIGFYGTTSAQQRDRVEVLLQDMVRTSGGKIADYEFVDPALQPIRTESYLGETPRLPSIVVAAIDPTTGLASEENFEVAIGTGQFQLINAILSLSVSGDFRAYFFNIEGALDIESPSDSGADGIVSDLDSDWTVEQVDPLRLASPNPSVILNDPTASAEVIIIPGGTQVLSDAEVDVLRTYAQNGGDLIVFGDINTEGGTTTAQAENFSNFLWETFGVRLRNDLVLDPTEPVSSNGRTFLLNNYSTHPIVAGLQDDEFIVFNSPHSIEISDTPPANVTITPLISTSEDGYARADIDYTRDYTVEELAFVEGVDLSGEIPVAVAVENTATGARLVLVGSPDLMRNEWRRFGNIEAPEVSESAIVWASGAQNFSEVVRQLIPEPNNEQPVLIREAQVRWMGFVAIFILPFGMLALGVLVWWLRRPSRTQ